MNDAPLPRNVSGAASAPTAARRLTALGGARPGERVLVAMSGGVDSSVAALVLRDAGLEAQGVTLKLFENEDACLADSRACCSLKDAEDARQVCLTLGIPHYVYNFTRTFNADVIDRFCDGYLRGETPNPCIDCNRFVKFAALQQRRRELGFDYVATGHYARRAYDPESDRYLLKCGIDANKDQSYVLFHLTQDHLAHMLFPLGELTKSQVRALARESGFINASKQESQDICFVPDGDYASFIRARRGVAPAPGNIVDRAGRVLGRHAGLIGYTVGQRKGIGVAASEPLYVYAKDVARNELVVDVDAKTRRDTLEVREVNLIAAASLARPRRLLVKAHYRQKARPATVEQIDDARVRVRFDEPQRACAPGQAAVFYDGDIVVGGGTIAE